jgi:hypothetical protein
MFVICRLPAHRPQVDYELFEFCLLRIAAAAEPLGVAVEVDMEQLEYRTDTLNGFRAMLAKYPALRARIAHQVCARACVCVLCPRA